MIRTSVVVRGRTEKPKHDELIDWIGTCSLEYWLNTYHWKRRVPNKAASIWSQYMSRQLVGRTGHQMVANLCFGRTMVVAIVTEQ